MAAATARSASASAGIAAYKCKKYTVYVSANFLKALGLEPIEREAAKTRGRSAKKEPRRNDDIGDEYM